MRNLIITIISALILIPVGASAISITYDWYKFVDISNWVENDILLKKENSMLTNLTITMEVKKNITHFSNETTLNLTISPKENYWNKNINKEDILVDVVDSTNCLRDFNTNTKLNHDLIDGDYEFNKFILIIRLSETDFGRCDYKFIDISIKYKIENYLQKRGDLYLAFLSSTIFPQKPSYFYRTLYLGDKKYEPKDLPLHLMRAGFTDENDNSTIWRIDTNEYQNDFIYIEDTEETNFLTPFSWNILYPLFASIITVPIILYAEHFFLRPRFRISIPKKLEEREQKYENKKFLRLRVENCPLGKMFGFGDKANNCASKIEFIRKSDNKKIFNESKTTKWASRGEPYDFVLSKDNGVETLKFFPHPINFQATEKEDIPIGEPKLLDIAWKIKGNDFCFVRKASDYWYVHFNKWDRLDKMEAGEFIIRVTISDENNNKITKDFLLKNCGKDLENFSIEELTSL